MPLEQTIQQEAANTQAALVPTEQTHLRLRRPIDDIRDEYLTMCKDAYASGDCIRNWEITDADVKAYAMQMDREREEYLQHVGFTD